MSDFILIFIACINHAVVDLTLLSLAVFTRAIVHKCLMLGMTHCLVVNVYAEVEWCIMLHLQS